MGGAPLETLRSSRGTVASEDDNDGDLDVAIWNRYEAPVLLRNDLTGGGNWLQIEAPVGTRIVVNGHAQEVMSQASFYSAPGRVLHFGLGKGTAGDIGMGEKSIKGVAVNKRYSWGADAVIREIKAGHR